MLKVFRLLIAVGLSVFSCIAFGTTSVSAKMRWTIAPTEETAGNEDTPFIVADPPGQPRRLYDSSFAVLVVEEHYSSGWEPATDQGEKSANLLKKALEERGFHVLVWKDLKGRDLDILIDEMVKNIGYRDDARLFFYYFGHGVRIGTGDDDSGARTFLVPIDAPDQNTDLTGFRGVAVPITKFRAAAGQMTLKHAFFAFEACQAGGLFDVTLSAPRPPNSSGYLFGDAVRRPVRQFLTAGDNQHEVIAGVFASLLVAALTEGERSGDGYVYGTDIISYVIKKSPQWSSPTAHLDPQNGSFPPSNGGDMIMGLANPKSASKSTNQKPKVDEAPAYRACRIPDNGVERWQNEVPWSDASGWLDGGNGQETVCNSLLANFMITHPGHVAELKNTSETSKRDIWQHVQYKYFCSGVDKTNPLYKEAKAVACGFDPGTDPKFVESEEVYFESGGTRDNRSDECKTHMSEVCVRSSNPKSVLIPGSARFKASQRSGNVFIDGDPKNADPVGTSNIGWFINVTTESPQKVCATVYARTSACETKVYIKGKLTAQELRAPG